MKKIKGRYKFFGIVLFVYIITAFFNLKLVKISLIDFGYIFIKILRILGLVIIIMTIMNLFLDSQKAKKFLSKSRGWKSRIIAIISGILIGGPPYVLYPMLKKMKEQGINNSLIAVFLYNRNVKIPFIPISILYFGTKFTIILSIYIVLFSILNGIIIGELVPSKKE